MKLFVGQLKTVPDGTIASYLFGLSAATTEPTKFAHLTGILRVLEILDKNETKLLPVAYDFFEGKTLVSVDLTGFLLFNVFETKSKIFSQYREWITKLKGDS